MHQDGLSHPLPDDDLGTVRDHDLRRVVHVSTSLAGGAGVAALRLARAQSGAGMSVGLITRDPHRQRSTLDPVAESLESLPIGALGRHASSAVTALNLAVQRRSSILFTPASATFAGRLAESVASYQVAHFHNIYNIARPHDLLALSRLLPSVVTLHDERLLTGGCHYSLGCSNFVESCRNCPQSRLPGLGVFPPARKHSRFLAESKKSLVFVVPSRWMKDQAIRAGLPEHMIHRIPNPIDTSCFAPGSRAESRLRLGLSPDDVIIAWQPGKNDLEMGRALASLQYSTAPEISARIRVITTSIVLHRLPFKYSVIPVSTEEERARFWSAADVGVSATRADNFPNVVLESLAVGTPFVIPAVGGAPEAIQETGGGLVAAAPEGGAIAHGLRRIIESRQLRTQLGDLGSDGVTRLYSPSATLPQFMRAYQVAATKHRLVALSSVVSNGSGLR